MYPSDILTYGITLLTYVLKLSIALAIAVYADMSYEKLSFSPPQTTISVIVFNSSGCAATKFWICSMKR